MRKQANLRYNVLQTMLTVYACQNDIVWENKSANFERIAARLADARPAAGSLIVLPEMFATGFSMNALAIAEDVQSGETAAFLSGLAQRHGCHVLGGVVTIGSDATRPRNEALVYSPEGTLTGRYAKMYPFTPSGEGVQYAAGTAPVIVEIGGLRVAPLICYDLRFPEVFRAALDRGAEAFVVIASWPVARIHHWSALLRARAIENQAFVVGVNRVGTDPAPFQYTGQSVVIDPSGAILTEANDQETILTAALDPAFLARYRQELPFLQDRQPVRF